MNLAEGITIDIAFGSTLTFHKDLNLTRNTLAKTRGWIKLINNILNAIGGTVTGLTGSIGGRDTSTVIWSI